MLTRANITDLRQAEMEAQRSRQELAHVSRVSTVGEMTASLAHQLNQPLTAIMANAQAGARILDAPAPDFVEIREILRDIVNDDRRASDVIQRLRRLLRKGEFELALVNLTSAIREVVDLVSSEAIIRKVRISLEFGEEPVFVRGDRVQLQQVMLNLIHNAMEAMSDQDDQPRTVEIMCRPLDNYSTLVIQVRDSGPGLRKVARMSCSNRSTRPSRAVWGWASRSCGLLSKPTMARSVQHDQGSHGAIFELQLPREPAPTP